MLLLATSASSWGRHHHHHSWGKGASSRFWGNQTRLKNKTIWLIKYLESHSTHAYFWKSFKKLRAPTRRGYAVRSWFTADVTWGRTAPARFICEPQWLEEAAPQHRLWAAALQPPVTPLLSRQLAAQSYGSLWGEGDAGEPRVSALTRAGCAHSMPSLKARLMALRLTEGTHPSLQSLQPCKISLKGCRNCV